MLLCLTQQHDQSFPLLVPQPNLTLPQKNICDIYPSPTPIPPLSDRSFAPSRYSSQRSPHLSFQV